MRTVVTFEISGRVVVTTPENSGITRDVSRYIHLSVKDYYDRSFVAYLRGLLFPRSRVLQPTKRVRKRSGAFLCYFPAYLRVSFSVIVIVISYIRVSFYSLP